MSQKILFFQKNSEGSDIEQANRVLFELKQEIDKWLEEVLDLNEDQLEQFNHVLQRTSLHNITNLLTIIDSRRHTLHILKELVFSPKIYNANEKLVQTTIENNYWLFDEQYELTAAEERDFVELLRRIMEQERRTAVTRQEVDIDDPDKLKQVDLCLVRRSKYQKKTEYIVVELKHPKVKLGRKELEQIKTQAKVIRNTPEFNSATSHWSFFLVGTELSSDEAIQGDIESAAAWGEKDKGLVHHDPTKNIKIYAQTWADIFEKYEFRYRHLTEALELEREEIAKNSSAEELVVAATTHAAISKPEYSSSKQKK